MLDKGRSIKTCKFRYKEKHFHGPMGSWSLKMTTEKWKNVSEYVKLNASYANYYCFFEITVVTIPVTARLQLSLLISSGHYHWSLTMIYRSLLWNICFCQQLNWIIEKFSYIATPNKLERQSPAQVLAAHIFCMFCWYVNETPTCYLRTKLTIP